MYSVPKVPVPTGRRAVRAEGRAAAWGAPDLRPRPWARSGLGHALVAAVLLGAAIQSDARAGEVALLPTRLHLSVPPGQDHTHVLQVMYGKDGPEDQTPVRLVFTEEDWDHGEDGRITFTKGVSTAESVRPWLVFSPSELEIVPGETGEVRVSIVVPEDAEPGEYRTALILQPRVPHRELKEGEKRFDVRLRLSTVVYVEVPPVAADAAMIDLAVVPGDKGWSIRSTFSNAGDVHLRITDEFEIYEMGGGAAASVSTDPIVLAGEPTEAGIVLPGRSRYFDRPLGAFSLHPGTFRLVYRAETGRDLPLLVGETVFEIPAEQPIIAGDSEQ